jgi:hypothetical protein
LGLYRGSTPSGELLQDVLDALSARGAQANGPAFAHRIEGSHPDAAGPTDREQEEVLVTRLDGLVESVLPDLRIMSVEVSGATIEDPDHAALVTLVRIDPEHLGIDRHPVAVVVSHDEYSGRPGAAAGDIDPDTRELFVALVEQVRPDYGAITVEWPLASPHSLAADPVAATDFTDFYVAEKYAGEAVAARAVNELRAALEVEVVRSPSGLYVFPTPGIGRRSRTAAAAEAPGRFLVDAALGHLGGIPGG